LTLSEFYFDHNATSPLRPEVASAMREVLSPTRMIGNPSSLHAVGRASRVLLGDAREMIARVLAVKPAQVIFTSGGTEANHLALNFPEHALITSAIEHESVLAARPEAQRCPVHADGTVNLRELEKLCAGVSGSKLLSVMLVNNETGAIQPLSEIAAMAQAQGALLHCDAVQALGKIPFTFASLGVDLLTLSAHKIGGPTGIGALIVKENLTPTRLLQGGGQEQRRRAGTENWLGAVGFGAAIGLLPDILAKQEMLRLWRDAFEQKILGIAPQARIAAQTVPRVANTSCVILPQVSATTQLMALDLAGFAVSSGAACSSGTVKASHVLKAMGLPSEMTGSALRISLGWNTTLAACEKLAEAWERMYNHAFCNNQRPV
jgi:cysteine desulfurase